MSRRSRRLKAVQMRVFTLVFLVLLGFMGVSWKYNNETRNVKCMIQLINYGGEGAYIAVSLLDSSDTYLETLYVACLF